VLESIELLLVLKNIIYVGKKKRGCNDLARMYRLLESRTTLSTIQYVDKTSARRARFVSSAHLCA